VRIIAQVALGIRLGIVLVLYELEGGDDQWRAVGQAGKAEQPLQVADYLASEGADVVAPDKDAERHDAAEHDQCRPSQYFSQTGHVHLLSIPDRTRCIAFRVNHASLSFFTLFFAIMYQPRRMWRSNGSAAHVAGFMEPPGGAGRLGVLLRL